MAQNPSADYNSDECMPSNASPQSTETSAGLSMFFLPFCKLFEPAKKKKKKIKLGMKFGAFQTIVAATSKHSRLQSINTLCHRIE
jgi:hypothetical protein